MRNHRPSSHFPSPERRPEPVGRVYLVTPGGLTAKGGIGRMVEYIHRTWPFEDSPLTVIDSYGPGSKGLMPFYYLRCLLRILADAIRGRIGLLHIHMSERLSVVRKGLIVHLAKAFRIPVVLHLHGADFADYCAGLSPARLDAVRRMMRKADAVVALGQFWRNFIHHELGLDPERITVLHNAVPGPSDLPNRPVSSRCRLLFLGVVCERKGVPTLLDALADSRLAHHPDWSIEFAGNGEVETYRAQAIRMGLGDRVHFHGWVDEARARTLLQQVDVLVLPSRNEGLPMAILEAMAYGLPIVSTPVGSIADAVTDGKNGFLVPVGDSIRLADALNALIADPELRLQMGQESRRRYLESFEISAFNARLGEIYHRAKRRLPVDTLEEYPDGSATAFAGPHWEAGK